MIDPKDRLVELGLRRMLGNTEDQPDLAERVRDAWNKGERRPAPKVRRSESAVPAEQETPQSGPRPRSWLPLAAAAGLTATVAGFWALAASKGGDSPATPDTRSAQQDANTGQQSPSVPPTPPDLALEDLSQRIPAAQTERRVDLPGNGQLVLAAGTELDAALQLDRAGSASAYGLLDLSVLRGEARIESEEGVLPLTTQQPERLLLGPNGPQLVREEWLQLPQEIAILGIESPSPGQRLETWQREGTEGIFALLREEPGLWFMTRDAVGDWLGRQAAPSYVQRELVDILALDESVQAAGLARTAWRAIPSRFSSDAQVAFAERGAFEFERECSAFFDHWDENSPSDPLPMALWNAQRGNPRAARVLLAANSEVEPVIKGLEYDEGFLRATAAAASLARLGNPMAWEEIRPRWTSMLMGFLEDQSPKLAADTLLAFDYLHAIAEGEAPIGSTQPPRTSFLQYRIGRYGAMRRESYVSADAVRERMQQLGLR